MFDIIKNEFFFLLVFYHVSVVFVYGVGEL